MRRLLSMPALAVLLLVCTLPCSTPAHAKKPAQPPGGGGGGGGVSFTAVELPAPDNIVPFGKVLPLDVNEHKHVVGQVEIASNVYEALYWSVNGDSLTTISLGSDAVAYGLNDHDQIVGGLRDNVSGEAVPVLWPNPTSTPIALGLPAGHSSGWVRRINNDGLLVGQTREWYSDRDENGEPVLRQRGHAVSWQVFVNGGQITISAPKIIGTLAVGKDNWCYDVSAAVQVEDGVFYSTVVGTAYNANDNARAVTWDLMAYTDAFDVIHIDVVGGPTDVGTLSDSYGNAINKYGDVTGTPGYVKLYGEPIELLSPPSSVNQPGISYVADINDAAEIVAEHWYGYGSEIPVLWLSDGTAYDINKSLGGTDWANLHSPTSINNGRVIVGYGLKYEGKGKNRITVDGAFMLIPD